METNEIEFCSQHLNIKTHNSKPVTSQALDFCINASNLIYKRNANVSSTFLYDVNKITIFNSESS